MALFISGHIQQPEQQEECHHGGHEIGIRDLPGATMVAAAALDDFFDNNCGFAVRHDLSPQCLLPATLSRCQFSRCILKLDKARPIMTGQGLAREFNGYSRRIALHVG